MKDYDHVVVWLDYFNKNLSRAKGRRQPRDRCVFDPTISELADAVKAAGLEIVQTRDDVRFPKKPYVRSGYVVLPKTAPKGRILGSISKRMASRRAKKPKA